MNLEHDELEGELKNDGNLKLIKPRSGALSLTVLSGKHEGDSLELESDPIFVGDEAFCQLPLTDAQLKGASIQVERDHDNAKVTIKKGAVKLYLVDESGKPQVKVDDSTVIEEGESISLNGVRIGLGHMSKADQLSEDANVSVLPVDKKPEMNKADLLESLYEADQENSADNLAINDEAPYEDTTLENETQGDLTVDTPQDAQKTTSSSLGEFIKGADKLTIFSGLAIAILLLVMVAYLVLGRPEINDIEPGKANDTDNRYQVTGMNSNGAVVTKGPVSIELAQLKKAQKDILQLKSIFSRMLIARELPVTIELNVNHRNLEVTGVIDKRKVSILNRMLARFKREQGLEQVTIKNTVKSDRVQLPFKIVQVTSGRHGNVLIEGGERVFIGDGFDGFQLMAIESEHIIFSRDGKQIKLPW